MTIRAASAADVEAIADLLADGRVRQQAWEPGFWAIAPEARHVHPLFLDLVLSRASTIARVCSTDGRVDAVAIATPLAGAFNGRGPAWVIDDFAVGTIDDWRRLGPVLLASVAARARTMGATSLVVACPHRDGDRTAMLASAGLSVSGWYRHLRHGAPSAGPGTDGPIDDDLPLPVLHGMIPAMLDGDTVRTDGAAGRRSRPMSPPPVYRPEGTTTLVDSIAAVDRDAAEDFVGVIEHESRDRGDAGLLVVAGPGQPTLDDVLDRRGYRRLVDWWSLTLT